MWHAYFRRLGRIAAASALGLALWACAGPAPRVPPPAPAPAGPAAQVEVPWFERLSPATQNLASWDALAPAVDASLAYVAKKPAGAVALDRPGARLTWADLAETLRELRRRLPELKNDPSLFKKYFAWTAIEPGTLLTGYYEPAVPVSHLRSAAYPWPIYKNPGRGGKGPSREDIDYKGAHGGKGLELAFAKDQIDVFFLHVQGSGKLVFEDGSTAYALFDGTNGRRYVGVGRVMVDAGCFPQDEMSMQRIRAYLEAHPDEIKRWLTANPGYVYFKLSQTKPVGAMGASVTPWGSVAVDPGFIPLGALLAVDGFLPGYPGPAPERFTGIVLAQDTGCMRGNHLDLYCGPGDKAAHQAGLMKDTARVYVLTIRREGRS